MAPVLPSSLSPHICILSSPDLDQVLALASLPPLPNILQSFSPLPQVTTRTTTLTSVPHTSFALRFSNLAEIEIACREDEEGRAARTIDWISARISSRCGKWVANMEKAAAENKEKRDIVRTPWWDELRRCVEGDCIPSRSEAWNHPVAIIYAVSTATPNPLAAISALHARAIDLPPWVDQTRLTFTLVIHPSNSALSDEEAGALFNAVKTQYGLHSYLLPLAMPSPPPPAVPVPAVLPRLPPIPSSGHVTRASSPTPASSPPSRRSTSPMPPSTPMPPQTPMPPLRTPLPLSTFTPIPAPLPNAGPTPSSTVSTLKMSEQDIQTTARFVREFLTMSLIPFMERCVIEWNETYSSSRRLPSRLFSSTRRLFGSAAPSPAPSPAPGQPRHSHSSTSSQASILSGSTAVGGVNEPPPQQRRLAEFATTLGDFKLAVSVWENLRKELRGGSDILPMFLAPGPNVQLYASHALTSLHPLMQSHGVELPSTVTVRAVTYAVRWEIAVSPQDFLGDVLEGDRWLVWAAGNAEEAPSALLLGHAALLSARRRSRRRAALWYFLAASRLEKCGIKPLTMYFLRQASELYTFRPEKSLSPSFWEADERTSDDWEGFDAIKPGLGHALGRLLYTTGDIPSAIRLFLGLLRGQSRPSVSFGALANGDAHAQHAEPNPDKVFVDDFRVAFQHFLSTAEDGEAMLDLKLSCQFCIPKRCRVRFPGRAAPEETDTWSEREETWRAFWKPRGKESLDAAEKAPVDETFWFDLALENPLEVEVSLSNLTLHVREAASDSFDSAKEFVEVEVVNNISLDPKESRSIPISILSRRPASLIVAEASFDFLSILPCRENLASRGRRLHDTPIQRQSKTYGPDVFIKADVRETNQRLQANFVEDDHLLLAHGEHRRMDVWLQNTGIRPVGEIWMVAGYNDLLFVDLPGSESKSGNSLGESYQSNNSLETTGPVSITLSSISDSPTLNPGQAVKLPLIFYADQVHSSELSILFTFREGPEGTVFHCTRVSRPYDVLSVIGVSVSCQPGEASDYPFIANLELEDVSAASEVQITQITVLSPSWKCNPISSPSLASMASLQAARMSYGVVPWDEGQGGEETLQFVAENVRRLLNGQSQPARVAPPLDISVTHLPQHPQRVRSMADPQIRHFIHSGRQRYVTRQLSVSYPHIPAASRSRIFPLYNPACIDFAIFWEMPGLRRRGHLLVPGLLLGAKHGALREIIQEAAEAKVQRNMYAETQREKMEVMEAVKASEWNAEMNPVVVQVQDGLRLEHDFAASPCQAAIAFTLRNLSRTHPSRFTLKLGGTPTHTYPPAHDLMPPRFIGRRIFRGFLKPMQSVVVHPKIQCNSPGSYSLARWSLETDVGEPLNSDDASWRTRDHYLQQPDAGDHTCFTVFDSTPKAVTVTQNP